MKFYVIARFEDKDVARVVMEMMLARGHELTFDWTRVPEALTDEDRVRSAARDFHGVVEADAVIVLHDDQLCNGLVELGVALALGKRIMVVGPPFRFDARRQPIFYWIPKVLQFYSAEGAVRFLCSEQA